MTFEYRQRNEEYRKSAPLKLGTTYRFENSGLASVRIYFSIAFIPFAPILVKLKTYYMQHFFDTLILRLNKWWTRKIKYLSITIDSGTEKSQHKILFSGFGKYNFIHSDVFNDWVDIVSNSFKGELKQMSITVQALDASGHVMKPSFLHGCLYLTEPLFLSSKRQRNIVFITGESLNDPDYLLKEQMISQDTYDLYKKVFAHFTFIDRTVSQGDWTFPNTFTLHTGLLPSQHKMFNSARIIKGIDRLNEKILTFPQMLKKEGYLTFSATLGRVNPEFGFAKGFDFYFKPVNPLGSFVYTGDEKWVMNKLEHFESNCYIHVHLDRLHAPFCTTSNPWSRVKKLSTPEMLEDDTLVNPEGYYEKNLRYLLLEFNNFISYLKFNNAFEDTIFIVSGDHGTAIGEWFNICQQNSLVDSRVRIPYLINQKTNLTSRNANIRHIEDIATLLQITLPDYLKGLPQHQKELSAYSFSEGILKTRKDLYVLAIRNETYTYFYFADVNWNNFTLLRFVEEYVVRASDNVRIEDPTVLKQFAGARELFFKLNQDFYKTMHLAPTEAK